MAYRLHTLFLALPCALLCACAPEPSAARGVDRPNVVLICLDTVRADHLGIYGYEQAETTPWIDSLARRGTLFLDCSASACWTKPSVPSFLTGTYPLQHGVYRGSARKEGSAFSDVLGEDALTLAEVFQAAGYRTGAFVRNAQLRRGMGFEQGFESYVDKAGDAREIRWRARDWIDSLDGEEPFFLYLHYLDAHWPYPVPDEYATRFAAAEAVADIRSSDWRELRDAVNSGKRKLSDDEHAAVVGLYDGALRYMDDQLALFDRYLEREGLAENTILCIVADHGEEFGEHGKLGHGHGLYEGLLSVPWILYVPGHEPRRVETPVSLIDLFPTLLGSAGIQAPASEGIDRLADPLLQRPIFAEHLDPGRYHRSWRRGRSKMITIVRPERPADRSEASLSDLDVGLRFEARVTPGEGGRLYAQRLRPAHHQESRPPELKGTIESVDSEGIVLLGRVVRITQRTELYGDEDQVQAGLAALRPGLLVKARGPLEGEVLIADKLKLYTEGSELESEVRGVLSRDAAGRFFVGGIGVEVDGETELELGGERGDLSREDVLALLDGELGEAERTDSIYDLTVDPTEHSPASGPPLVRPGEEAKWLAERLSRRTWGRMRALDEGELQDLRAIGYAQEE